MTRAYRILPQEGTLHFVTTTIIDWIPLFLSWHTCDIIIDALRYCRREKGLRIHAYVIMSNHLHLILSTVGARSLSDVMRDFKRYTSRKITEQLEQEGAGVRLDLLRHRATRGKGNVDYKVWADGYHPVVVSSLDFSRQKLNYIHDNPVRKGLVRRQEEWRYSSAGDYITGVAGDLEIDKIDLV